MVTIALSLVAPYVAGRWELLGHQPSVANAAWPAVDPALLVTDAVTCVVQVQGKVRARLQVRPTIGEAELRSLALAEDGVVEPWPAGTWRRSSSALPSWSASSR